ncbi:retrovirus-related pol polyprotein from transposon TNT 1-94 [Tanacetum coccineum]
MISTTRVLELLYMDLFGPSSIQSYDGELDERTLRSHAQDKSNFFAFASTIEPKKIKEAIKDESWTMAMQEELDQFIRNNVWDLVPCPVGHTIIGTKWVFRNKLDENGIVCRKKARLVAQGYNQQEGIDYDETYAPDARLESIRILLAYACCYMFKRFQMDVKSVFLNGVINEEVYIAQPPGFINFQKPNHVYKLKKTLYGLKQAPKAWYDRLQSILITKEYKMRIVDNTLFTKVKDLHLIIIQIYIDDIIFGSTCQSLCNEFSKLMHDEFEMSMMDSKKILRKMSNSKESAYEGEIGESSKKMKMKFETMKGYEGDERMESREILLFIHHSLKMLLDIISKMNRKLEDEKIKMNYKGKVKCMTRSSTSELFTPYKEPEREFRTSRRHFKTLSLNELRSPDFNLFSDQEYSEEEVAETMSETMEQYMSKTRADYGSGVARPKIEDKDNITPRVFRSFYDVI